VYPGKCLILGFGSDALSDDGLPVRLVNDLKIAEKRDFFHFETSPVGGLELLDLLNGFDSVVLIDTQLTSRREAGEIHDFTPYDFEETFHLSSQHDLTFHEAFRFANEMGISMPGEIRIIAIEIVENKKLSFEFSDEIEKKYQSILSYLCRVLDKISGIDE
jgi:hydrogenase maturation protease